MTRAIFFVLVCGMLTIVSCVKKDESEMLRAADGAAQHAQWADAIDGYNSVLKDFPDGKHAAEAMFKSGMIQSNQLKDYGAAVKTFQDVVNKYAASAEAPKALMTLGFLYANQPAVKNLDTAKQYYRLLVSHYPSSNLAPSANTELENLGQSPDEMLRRAQEQHPGKSEFSRDSIVRAPSAQALAH